jgi:septal ring factor EnvC (AmiA/AmiB activator)
MNPEYFIEGVSILACGHPHFRNSLEPLNMSSTLFQRGITSQVGMRARAELVNKNISDLKVTLESLKALPEEFAEVKNQVKSSADSLRPVTSDVNELKNLVRSLEARLVALENRVRSIAVTTP